MVRSGECTICELPLSFYIHVSDTVDGTLAVLKAELERKQLESDLQFESLLFFLSGFYRRLCLCWKLF